MTKQYTPTELRATMQAYGLNNGDSKHIEAVSTHLAYLQNQNPDADSQKQLDLAAALAARQLGVRSPLPKTKADPNDFRTRYANSLPAEQRQTALDHMKAKADPAAQAERNAQEQVNLRAEFIDQVKRQAVDYSRGAILDDRVLSRIKQEFQNRGLSNLKITRQEIGQDDQALLQRLAGSPAVKSGAYLPHLHVSEDGTVTDTDWQEDHRQQGSRASWFSNTQFGGSGK